MHRVTLILRDDPDPNDDGFMDELDLGIVRLNREAMHFELEENEELADGTVQMLWVWDEDDDLYGTLTLVREEQPPICSLTVAAARSSHLRRVVALLEDSLSIIPLDELKVAARPKLLMDPASLLKLGQACSYFVSPDKDAVELIEAGLRHRSEKVRYCAVCAVWQTAWPVFIPPLEELLKGVMESEVRETALSALERCTQRIG